VKRERRERERGRERGQRERERGGEREVMFLLILIFNQAVIAKSRLKVRKNIILRVLENISRQYYCLSITENSIIAK